MNKNKVTKSILSQHLSQWRKKIPTCQVMFEIGLCKEIEGAELKSSHTQEVKRRSFSTTVPALSHETQQGACFALLCFTLKSLFCPLPCKVKKDSNHSSRDTIQQWLMECLVLVLLSFFFPLKMNTFWSWADVNNRRAKKQLFDICAVKINSEIGVLVFICLISGKSFILLSFL